MISFSDPQIRHGLELIHTAPLGSRITLLEDPNYIAIVAHVSTAPYLVKKDGSVEPIRWNLK